MAWRGTPEESSLGVTVSLTSVWDISLPSPARNGDAGLRERKGGLKAKSHPSFLLLIVTVV